MPQQTRLKTLLQERHWQTYRTFRDQYDRSAKQLDRDLIGTWPSRAQFHRWLSGEVRTAPYPDACRVLERMFPGWRTADLFAMHDTDSLNGAGATDPAEVDLAQLLTEQLRSPRSDSSPWRSHVPAEMSPLSAVDDRPAGDPMADMSRRLVSVSRIKRFSAVETQQLAGLAGSLVDLDMSVDIDIQPDGWATVTHRQEILNLTDKPFTRMPKDLWFEHTAGKLEIKALGSESRRIALQRIHDTATSAQFALQFSPPVQPGDAADAAWSCAGVQFLSDHYWRQSVPRYTRHLTVRVRHRAGQALASCSGLETHADGGENTIPQAVMWDVEGNDVLVTLTRDYLRPGESVTLRWEVARAST